MSDRFRKTRIVFVAVISGFMISSSMLARAQSAPAAGQANGSGNSSGDSSGNTPAPVRNSAQDGKAAPTPGAVPDQLPSNYRLVPNAENGNVSSESLHPKIVESWTTPALEGSHFGPAQPVKLGESGAVDNAYTNEIQRVTWRAGDPIDLYIIKPVGVEKPPVILYLYSYPFETDRFVNEDFCKFLVRNGMAAVGFPSALTAGRYQGRPMKQWFVSEMRESLAKTAHDVQLILNYLSDRGDFDMNRVGMFGDGSGASIAILAAAVDPRIKSLDLVDPWGDWPDWVAKSDRIPDNERPNFLKQEWLDANAPMDPLKWLPQLKTPNLRLQFVESIGITPPEAQAKIAAAVPKQAKIVRYENAAAFKASVAHGSGLDWLKDHVRGEVAQQYGAGSQEQVKVSTQSQSPRQ